MCSILNLWRKDIVLVVYQPVISEIEPTGDINVDMRELKTILKFTAQVLTNSLYKDVYNSVEVSLSFQTCVMYGSF